MRHIEAFPAHGRYVEPFCGSAVVFFLGDPSPSRRPSICRQVRHPIRNGRDGAKPDGWELLIRNISGLISFPAPVSFGSALFRFCRRMETAIRRRSAPYRVNRNSPTKAPGTLLPPSARRP
jgi:hypothetical protein